MIDQQKETPCPKCGSTNVWLEKNKVNKLVYWVCLDCGWFGDDEDSREWEKEHDA